MVVIVCDTFRADHLGCFGNERVKTPNLDSLAAEGAVFTNVYADGLPTIPERRVLFTGKSIVPARVHGGWTPLRPDDVTFPKVLQENGYTTAFITDVYHYFKPGMNFHANFDTWEWIRGQEFDMWRSGPRDAVDPRQHMPAHLWHDGKQTHRTYENCDERMRRYMLNTLERRSEEDYFCARSFRTAMTWLERNLGDRPFVILIDTFDPHEPWDAPPRFQEMYHDDYPCERFLFGYGMDFRDVRPEDGDAIRALYAAEVTFVDMWIGRFLARLEELGLRENTVVFFTTDHGTHLGEEGCWTKTPELLNSCVARLPLIVRHPDPDLAGGKRFDALVSSVDYMPTFMDALGVEDAPPSDGSSLLALMRGERDSLHERVFTEFGRFGAVRTPEWHYFQHVAGENPGKGPCLYDLAEDPGETRNVLEQKPEVAAELRGQLQERFGTELPAVPT
jgi:arylsulfatase A-like enzyme